MATRTFHGDAPDIQDTWTLTPGTVGIGNTFTMTINGKTVTVTATAATVLNVTALFAAALNANADKILEVGELKAVDNTTLITVTVRTKGIPTVITSGASGGSATFVAVNTTAASGSNFADSAVNYDGDTIAVDTDSVVVSNGSSDILHGLDQSLVALASLIVKPSSGKIGLPKLHKSGNRSYDEFRQEALTWESVTALEILSKASRVKLNTGTAALCKALINSEAIREDPEVPAILLLGAHASNELTILRGDVGVAFYEGETADWGVVNVGYVTDQLGDVELVLGNGMSTIDALTQNGGRVDCEAVVTLLDLAAGIFTAKAGAITTANIDGGDFIELGEATITTLNVGNGGFADFSQDVRAITVTNCNLHAGARLHDPLRRVTFTNGIDLVRCGLDDVDLQVGEHVSLALSNI